MGWTERTTRRFFFVIAPTLLMLAVIAVVFGHDDAVADAMRQFRGATPALSVFFEYFSDYGNIPFYIAYLVILVRAVKTRDREAGRFIGFSLVTLAATLVVVYCLKVAVSRARPFIHHHHDGPFSFSKKFHSFPSNHVSGTLAVTVPFALRHGSVLLAVGLGLFNALASFSRLYLGSHFPTDILGSVVLACLVTGAWVLAERTGCLRRLRRRILIATSSRRRYGG